MPTLRTMGYTACVKPMPVSSNPTRVTTDRRAVCGKTARTVRREGRPNSIGRSYPYQDDCRAKTHFRTRSQVGNTDRKYF